MRFRPKGRQREQQRDGQEQGYRLTDEPGLGGSTEMAVVRYRQVMSEVEAQSYAIHPFDLTKVWHHADYPLIEVGTLELNRNPKNPCGEVEHAT